MGGRIKLPARDSGTRVELGEHADGAMEFSVKPITLELEETLSEIQREAATVQENPDSRPADLCEVEVKQLDVILEPTSSPLNTGKATVVPSEILLGDLGDPNAEPPRPRREGYYTGAVTRAQIQSLVRRVIEEARPI